MRSTNRLVLVATLALAAGACAEVPTSAMSAAHPSARTTPRELPLDGRCETRSTTVLGMSAGVLTQLTTADCVMTHLGRVTISNLQRVTLATLEQYGEATWTTASGDVLNATSIGQAVATGPGTLAFSGVTTLASGTGRFANAEGRLIVAGTVDNVNGTGAFTFHGWISYAASDRARR